MIFSVRTFRNSRGQIVIQNLLRPPADERKDYEDLLPRSTEVGLKGWGRGHSQGAGTGNESTEGIRYVPAEVNRKLQNHGIENYIRDLVKEKDPYVDLWLTTVTTTHPGSLRLAEIEYQVDAVHEGRSRTVFEATIKISNSKSNPVVDVQFTARDLTSSEF